MSKGSKRCPFDKNPCIRDDCAVWSEETGACSFLSIPDLIHFMKTNQNTVKQSSVRRDPEPSGGGKYRTLLFD